MNRIATFVATLVTITLCFVVVAMVIAMLHGLFVENIDNAKIFEAITPAFQTIIGGFIGLITGIKIGKDDNAGD